MYKIFDFAHIFVDLQPIRPKKEKKFNLDDVRHLLSLFHSEINVSGISTEKALYQNIKKHHFSADLTRLLTPEAKIEQK